MTPDPRKQSPARLRATEERLRLLRKRWEFQQAVCHSSGRGACQQRTPTQTPGLFSSSTQDPPFFPSSGVSQTAEETLCSGRPPASNLHGQHHETSPGSTTNKFRVSLFLATLSHRDCHSLIVRRSSPGRPIAVQSAHQCGIQRSLGSSEQGQPINCHFESATVCCVWQVKVQVAHKHIRAHTPTCFSTDARHHTLQRETPSPQDPSPCASCAVMAINIEWAATPAGTHVEGDARGGYGSVARPFS